MKGKCKQCGFERERNRAETEAFAEENLSIICPLCLNTEPAKEWLRRAN